MKTSTIFLAVASIIAGALAAPAAAEPALPPNVIYAELRSDGNTTYTKIDNSDFSALAVRRSLQCSARNFGGTCYTFTFDSGYCCKYTLEPRSLGHLFVV